MASWQSSRVDSWSWPSSRDPSRAAKDEWAQWKCGYCHDFNWQHYGSQAKRCRTCGIKKSYKDAAQQHSGISTTSNNNNNNNHAYRNSVSAKLAEVASHLQAAVMPQPASTEADRSNVAAIRKASSEEIASLEAALASIPNNEEYAATRAALEAKIAEKKESIFRARPIGKQIDEGQQLVARCRARREHAVQAAAIAQAALAETDQALAVAETRLRALQAEMAASEPPQQVQCSMASLDASFFKIMADMRGGGCVSDVAMQQTETHMMQLMSGLRRISEDALAKAAAKQWTEPMAGCMAGWTAGHTAEQTAVEPGEPTPKRMMTKSAGSPDVAPPNIPPRSDVRGEADLMQAFPPVHSSPHGG